MLHLNNTIATYFNLKLKETLDLVNMVFPSVTELGALKISLEHVFAHIYIQNGEAVRHFAQKLLSNSLCPIKGRNSNGCWFSCNWELVI